MIIYGLSEDAVTAFFDSFFAIVRDPGPLLPTSYLRAGDVSQKVASRLVPLLHAVFPSGFHLTQIVWPDSNGFYRLTPDEVWQVHSYVKSTDHYE